MKNKYSKLEKKEYGYVMTLICLFLFFLIIPQFQNSYADTVIATIPISGGPWGVTFDSANGNIYVTNEFVNTVSVIHSSNNTVTSVIPVGSNPIDITFDSANGNIYVVNTSSNTVSVIDGSSNTVTSTIPVGLSPDGIVFDSANGNIYVVNTSSNTVSVIDGSSNTVTSTIPVGNQPSGIAIGHGNVYVTNDGDLTVSVIDSSNNTVTSTIPVGNAPLGIVVGNGYIYVANSGSNTISVINNLNTVISTIPVGTGPYYAVFDSANGNIYVTNDGSGTVSVIRSSSNTVTSVIPVGSNPIGIAFDSANGNIYVADQSSNDVTVIAGTVLKSSSASGDSPAPSMIKPSFGGVGTMIFHDGLTINNKAYDLKDYNDNIPKNIAQVNKTTTITIKQQSFFGSAYWQHVEIGMNFGLKDTEMYNSNLILSDDKKDGAQLIDPQGYIKNFNATTTIDSLYSYTTFQFTAAKAMPDTNMMVSAWDRHGRVNTVRVHGAIQFGPDMAVISDQKSNWIQTYDNAHDADIAIENAGYVKPLIFSRITYAEQVWGGSDGGSVNWDFDPKNGTISITILDKNENPVYEKTMVLEKSMPKITSVYSWDALNQISRTNIEKLDRVCKTEQDRVQTTLQNMGYVNYFYNTTN